MMENQALVLCLKVLSFLMVRQALIGDSTDFKLLEKMFEGKDSYIKYMIVLEIPTQKRNNNISGTEGT